MHRVTEENCRERPVWEQDTLPALQASKTEHSGFIRLSHYLCIQGNSVKQRRWSPGEFTAAFLLSLLQNGRKVQLYLPCSHPLEKGVPGTGLTPCQTRYVRQPSSQPVLGTVLKLNTQIHLAPYLCKGSSGSLHRVRMPLYPPPFGP